MAKFSLRYSLLTLCSVLFTIPLAGIANTLPAPEELEITQIRTRSAYVTWNNITNTNNLNYYSLKVKNSNGGVVYSKKIKKNFNSERNKQRLHDLKPGKHYTVLVKTVKSNKKSSNTKQTITTASSHSGKKKWPLIDVEAHVATNSDFTDVTKLLSAMDNWNVTHSILMPTPSALEKIKIPGRASQVTTFVDTNTDTLTVLYGGAKLNPLLYILGDNFVLDVDTIYPSGYTEDHTEEMATAQEILDNPTTYENIFISRATEAAESGNYIGFGEIAPEHESLRENHPYISFPVNSPLLLELADLSAEYDMPISVHFEPNEERVAELEELLEHNSEANIVWSHAGWYDSGYDNPALYTSLLANHDNLYLSLKMREPKKDRFNAHYPLKKNGTLRSNWKTLLTTHKDKIMIGVDNKYWNNRDETPKSEMRANTERVQELLDILPKNTAKAISQTTAQSLYNLE